MLFIFFIDILLKLSLMVTKNGEQKQFYKINLLFIRNGNRLEKIHMTHDV